MYLGSPVASALALMPLRHFNYIVRTFPAAVKRAGRIFVAAPTRSVHIVYAVIIQHTRISKAQNVRLYNIRSCFFFYVKPCGNFALTALYIVCLEMFNGAHSRIPPFVYNDYARFLVCHVCFYRIFKIIKRFCKLCRLSPLRGINYYLIL